MCAATDPLALVGAATLADFALASRRIKTNEYSRSSMKLHYFVIALAVVPAARPQSVEAQPTTCRRVGGYNITISVGAQTVAGRLELTCLDGRHWGRISVALRDSVYGAMSETALRGDTIDFRMGGAFAGFELVPRGDSIHGRVLLGQPVAYTGVRTSPAPTVSLDPHSTVRPWEGVTTPDDSGQSYPVMLDAETVVFTRHGRRLAQQRLMVASRQGATWTIRPLTVPGDVAASERGPALLPGGSGIVFASTRRLPSDTAVSPRFRLWIVTRQGGQWGTPTPYAAAASAAGDGAQQPTVTAAGAVYFSSQRPGGLGGRDLYRLDPGADAPVPLGAPASSPGDEHGAWISPAGDLLIVSGGGGRSAAHGGDDLYWSVRSDSGWSEPQLLPVPINSFGNEYGASLSADRRTLWFTSDRFGIARLFQVDLARYGVRLPGAR